jgi:hypothetical protein
MIYMWTLKFLNKFRGYLMIRPASLDMSGVFSYEVYNVREIIIAIADGHGD